jgi:transcriptional regulator
MKHHKREALPGTLNLMILKTLETLGPLHGYGLARRIEQTSDHLLQLNQGTIYPALLYLEQRGWIRPKWGMSENNRRAKYYSITRAGQKQLAAETESWERTSQILTRFLAPAEENA